MAQEIVDKATTIMNVACRLCLSDGNGCRMFDIFTDVFPKLDPQWATSMTFAGAISFLLNQEVAESDHMPRRLCTACVEELHRQLKFRSGCDSKLKALRSSASTFVMPAEKQNLPQQVEYEGSNGQDNEQDIHVKQEVSSGEENEQENHMEHEEYNSQENEQATHVKQEGSSGQEFEQEAQNVKQEESNGEAKPMSKPMHKVGLVFRNQAWEVDIERYKHIRTSKLRALQKKVKKTRDLQLALSGECDSELQREARKQAAEALKAKLSRVRRLENQLQAARDMAVKREQVEVKPSTSGANLTNAVKIEQIEAKPSTSGANLTNAVKIEQVEAKPSTSGANLTNTVKIEQVEVKPSTSGANLTNAVKIEQVEAKPSTSGANLTNAVKIEQAEDKPSTSSANLIDAVKKEQAEDKEELRAIRRKKKKTRGRKARRKAISGSYVFWQKYLQDTEVVSPAMAASVSNILQMHRLRTPRPWE